MLSKSIANLIGKTHTSEAIPTLNYSNLFISPNKTKGSKQLDI